MNAKLQEVREALSLICQGAEAWPGGWSGAGKTANIAIDIINQLIAEQEAAVHGRNHEEVQEVISELRGGSNWLCGNYDVYSYNRYPKIAANVLSALEGMAIGKLVSELQLPHKWRREGFGHYKDVTTDISDAPFKAAKILTHMLYTTPQPSPAATPEGWKAGVEAVAKMLDKKADEYACEYGYEDMGSVSFGEGRHAEAKFDYHSGLIELAEEVRAMLAAAPTP